MGEKNIKLLTHENKQYEQKKEIILEKLQSESWEEIAKVELKPDQALEVERILRYYIEKVLEGKLRSMEDLNKLRKWFKIYE